MAMDLRPYQREAREAVWHEWETGHARTLLVMVTGGGKTIVFAAIIADCVRKGERVLVLAHRGELLEQAADKLEKSTGLRCAVEKAEETCLGSWYRVVVGSVQSLQQPRRLDRFPPDYFDTIVVDEAHHCLSDGYQRVLSHFSGAKVLGVTATPDRGDLRSLGSFFDSLAYEYTLPKAIREGYLCRIKALTIPLKLDLTGVRTQNGDYALNEVGTALDPYLEQIADEMKQICPARRTVVFLPLIRTGRKFCRMLNDRGFRAAEVNGQSEDRREILAAFEDGRYNVLCNSMLLTEGWDCPSVDCVVVLRPTKVRSLFVQMVGRGTRLFPGKDHLLLLDFLWLTRQMDLCRPACLIAENEEVGKALTERLEKEPAAVDLEAAEAQAEQDVVARREEALAKKLSEMRKRKRALVDPLQYELSINSADLAAYKPTFDWEKAPVSDTQRRQLEKAGIFPDEIECFGKAEALMKSLSGRREQGLATPKQVRFLEQRGFQKVGTWSFEAAKKLIDRIAVNHWRIPAGLDPLTYVPDKPNPDPLPHFDWPFGEEKGRDESRD